MAKTNFEAITEDIYMSVNYIKLELILKRFFLIMLFNPAFIPFSEICIPAAYYAYRFVVVQSLSHVQLFATLRTAARKPPLFSTITQSLFNFITIESMMLSNYLILCYPHLLLPSIFPSLRVFSNENTYC